MPVRHDVERDPGEQPAQQRVAVGVRSARRHADQHVAGGDVGPGEQRGSFGHADERAGDVERARRVHAGHLRRLAAEQRAPGGLARLGHPGDDLGDEVGVELAGGDVVEEEQRPRRLHEHVVDAVVDDVHADAANPAEPGGQLDLGADAVGRGDEHGIVHRRDRLRREHAAEAADAAHDLGAVGPLDGSLHPRRRPGCPRRCRPRRRRTTSGWRRGPATRCPGGPASRRTGRRRSRRRRRPEQPRGRPRAR